MRHRAQVWRGNDPWHDRCVERPAMHRAALTSFGLSSSTSTAPARLSAAFLYTSALLLAAACRPTAGKSDSEGSGGNAEQSKGGAGDTQAHGGPGGAEAKTCDSSAEPGDTVDVAGAMFTMGCNAQVDMECKDDENPAHAVMISAFAIDRTEVSQSQYS